MDRSGLTLRTLKKIKNYTIILSLFGTALIALACYGFLIEPNDLDISYLQVSNAELTKVLRGKRAVHLSDLHIREIGRREKKLLAILGEIEPDLIFLTGDYVKWGGEYDSALKFLSALDAELGVLAVMGDYDYSDSRKSCLFCHESGTGEPTRLHNVTFLRNSVERINIEGEPLWIGGMDDRVEGLFSIGAKPFIGEKNFPSIIMSHTPMNFELLEEDQDVLMLSGDTHGGQIPLPGWLWRILGYEKNAKYNQGLFQHGRKKMYVSRGIGTSHLPLRFLNRPEIVVIDF